MKTAMGAAEKAAFEAASNREDLAEDRHGDFFRRFFVTTGDTVRISIQVMVLGTLIGLIGSMIGLRKFLKI